jgi:hypothetical protein
MTKPTKFNTVLFGQEYVWEEIDGVWKLRLMDLTDLEIDDGEKE